MLTKYTDDISYMSISNYHKYWSLPKCSPSIWMNLTPWHLFPAVACVWWKQIETNNNTRWWTGLRVIHRTETMTITDTITIWLTISTPQTIIFRQFLKIKKKSCQPIRDSWFVDITFTDMKRNFSYRWSVCTSVLLYLLSYVYHYCSWSQWPEFLRRGFHLHQHNWCMNRG